MYALTAWDPDGPGPARAIVVAGGNFEHVGTTPLSFVGGWDGTTWRSLGSGVSGTVLCGTIFDRDGAGPILAQPVIGGFFSQSAGVPLNCVARFDGTTWQPFGTGLANPFIWPSVSALSPYMQGLVAAGTFETAGGVPAHEIARWDGSAWAAFTQDFFAFDTLGIHAGSLFAGGDFPMAGAPQVAVVRWNGTAWETVGINYPRVNVVALASFRGQLVAAGAFTNTCCGNPPAPGESIALFDGVTWRPLGPGLNGAVRALCVFDPDGPGPMPDLLIAGGAFSSAGGQFAANIAAWDGAQWSPILPGTSGTVRALTVWNNQLVVAGEFFSAGGLVSPGMAFWGCPLVLPCYPNCDNSTTAPILNISDFSCFLNSFASAGPYANCDGSTRAPTLNILDFICFINKFATGCP